MALRNQPYFPLYVQDYLTDEKLSLCRWETQGVYIKILCILHKQQVYGKLLFGSLFKQKDKQKLSSIKYFASVFVKLIPCQIADMENAIIDLVENEVLKIDDEGIYQNRMIKDFKKSQERSKAGKKGGGNPNLFKQKDKQEFKQTIKQNTEYEYENENEIEIIEKDKGGVGEKEKTNLPARMNAELTIQMSVTDNNRAHDVIDMQNNLPRGSGKKMAEIFLSMLDATGELQKHNPDDMSRYFINWANYHAKRLRPMLENAGNKSEVVSTYFEKTTGKQTPDEMLKSLHAYLK